MTDQLRRLGHRMLGRPLRRVLKLVLPDDVRMLRRNTSFARRGSLLMLTADGALGPAGSMLLMPHDAAIFPAVAATSNWAPEIVDFFAEKVDPARRYTVVDIGANVGLFTRQLAHRLSNIDRFLCVEPDPDNFRALSYNLASPAGAKAELFDVALSDVDGEAIFFRDAENTGNYSLNDDAVRNRPFDTIRVRCVEVATWMRESLRLGPQDRLLWKSDTQGHDEMIIARTPMEIWKQIDCASIELWRLRKPAYDRDAFVARLDDFPHKALSGGTAATTADVLAYLDSDDLAFTDLFLWR